MCGTGPAVAADLQAAAGASWSGCYVGANVGYVRGNVTAADKPFTDGPFAGSGFSWNSSGPNYETIDMDDGGASGGIEAGCDVELMPGDVPLIVGGVVDFGMLDLSGGNSSALYSDTKTHYSIDWAASFRARAGLGAGDVLFFVSGGLAVADVNVRAFDHGVSPTFGQMDVSGGGTETGWVAGAGAEWRVKPNLSLSLEYLHYDFGSITATGPAIDPAGAFPRFENDVRFDTIRVGLKWRM
ncbi:outer membrane beta-barrel protein (plasmid) [Rhizobium sp. RCAM05350]|nr:outer membrane beta-barrel protein [Rhizobium sp. RCAM05350]